MIRNRTITVRLSGDDLRKAAGAPKDASVTITGAYRDARDPGEHSPGYVTVSWTESTDHT